MAVVKVVATVFGVIALSLKIVRMKCILRRTWRAVATQLRNGDSLNAYALRDLPNTTPYNSYTQQKKVNEMFDVDKGFRILLSDPLRTQHARVLDLEDHKLPARFDTLRLSTVRQITEQIDVCRLQMLVVGSVFAASSKRIKALTHFLRMGGEQLRLHTLHLSFGFNYEGEWTRFSKLISPLLLILKDAPLTNLSLNLSTLIYDADLFPPFFKELDSIFTLEHLSIAGGINTENCSNFAPNIRTFRINGPGLSRLLLSGLTQSTLTAVDLCGWQCQDAIKSIPIATMRNLTALTVEWSTWQWRQTTGIATDIKPCFQNLCNLKKLHIITSNRFYQPVPWPIGRLLLLIQCLPCKGILKDLAIHLDGWDEQVVHDALSELHSLEKVYLRVRGPVAPRERVKVLSRDLRARGVKHVIIGKWD
ncbi:hypothetical protein HDV00_000431 [Rhizophlyctis rosea]|nr:hypothetical protein HDV00_000431 [Rhizophlyctis rosea]